MERRSFLQLFSLTAPVAAIAPAVNVHTQLTDAERQQRSALVEESLKFAAPPPGEKGMFLDRRAHGLYDLMLIPAGESVPTVWHFFADPIGSPIRGKCQWCAEPRGFVGLQSRSLIHTNSLCGNKLPPPVHFIVSRIVFLFDPNMDPVDRWALAEHYTFDLRIGGPKLVAQAPLARVPVSAELHALIEYDEKGVPTGRRNQAPLDSPFCFYLDRPAVIHPLEFYSLELRTEPARNFQAKRDIHLYAFLDGEGVFAVQ